MTPTDEFDPSLVDTQAASWFSRNRNTPSKGERDAFAQWMQTAEHARAYRQFEQLWDDLATLKQASRPVPCRRARALAPGPCGSGGVVCMLLVGNPGAGSAVSASTSPPARACRTCTCPTAASCTSTPRPGCAWTSTPSGG
jgi:transmembrane sensor